MHLHPITNTKDFAEIGALEHAPRLPIHNVSHSLFKLQGTSLAHSPGRN